MKLAAVFMCSEGEKEVGHRVVGGLRRGRGGVPVPFCILNSSTSVQPFSVVAAAGCDVCLCACLCVLHVCLSAYVHALLKVLVVTRTLIRRRQRLIFNNTCR